MMTKEKIVNYLDAAYVVAATTLVVLFTQSQA